MAGSSKESGSKPKKDRALVLPCTKVLAHFTHSKAKWCRKTRITTNKKTKYFTYTTIVCMYVYRSVFLIIIAETDVIVWIRWNYMWQCLWLLWSLCSYLKERKSKSKLAIKHQGYNTVVFTSQLSSLTGILWHLCTLLCRPALNLWRMWTGWVTSMSWISSMLTMRSLSLHETVRQTLSLTVGALPVWPRGLQW